MKVKLNRRKKKKPKLRLPKAEPEENSLEAWSEIINPPEFPRVDLGLPTAPSKPSAPKFWQKGLAGVQLTKKKGPGESKLDKLCHTNGLTWGIITTYCEGKTLRTSVLVGHVFDAGAERLIDNSSANAWDEVDEALGIIAEEIEASHGTEG